MTSWVQVPPPALKLAPTGFSQFLSGKIRAVTVQSYCKRVKALSKIGDLENPEKIRNVICVYPCSEAYKELLADSYDYYVQYRGLSWSKPKFIREDKPILLPLESELDQLIGNMRKPLIIRYKLRRTRYERLGPLM